MKTYCYICRRNRPCPVGAACKTLKGRERDSAYNLGYRELHGEEMNARVREINKARYLREHPGAVSQAERSILRAQAKAKRLSRLAEMSKAEQEAD